MDVHPQVTRFEVIDPAAWTEFLAVLDRPAQHKPRLEQLFAKPSIFDASASPPER